MILALAHRHAAPAFNGLFYATVATVIPVLFLAIAVLVFGDVEGRHRNPEHVSRQFARDIARCREKLGVDAPPVIWLHDLRHTHATILLSNREPVHVVSQRLGHASAVVTMTVYAHVLPGSQREAANLFARLIREAGA
jgi:integrase